eukprot:ctg_1650.g452
MACPPPAGETLGSARTEDAVIRWSNRWSVRPQESAHWSPRHPEPAYREDRSRVRRNFAFAGPFQNGNRNSSHPFRFRGRCSRAGSAKSTDEAERVPESDPR